MNGLCVNPCLVQLVIVFVGPLTDEITVTIGAIISVAVSIKVEEDVSSGGVEVVAGPPEVISVIVLVMELVGVSVKVLLMIDGVRVSVSVVETVIIGGVSVTTKGGWV